jgi:Ran-binding protein 1
LQQFLTYQHVLQPTVTPVFGASSTFGAGSGFAGFTGVTSTAAAPAESSAAADEEESTAPEEECQAEFKPVVQLEEVETTTGEEDETALAEM